MPGMRRALAVLTLLAQPWRRPVATAIGSSVVVLAVVVGQLADAGDLGADSAPFFLARLHQPLLGSVTAAIAVPLLTGVLAFAVLPRLPGLTVAPALFVLTLVARLGLNQALHGRLELAWPLYRDHGVREYPGAFHLVRGHVLRFIDHFAELVPTERMPVHPAGHPVGATLLAYWLRTLTDSRHAFAFLLVVLGCASAWPVLALARTLLENEIDARRAALLWGFAPATLIYGATSLDALFVGVAAIATLAVVKRNTVAIAVTSAGAFLLSYALALGPFLGALVLGRKRFARTALIAGGATLLLLGMMSLVFGYDPIGALRGTAKAYERGIGGKRPFAYWVFGGPAAFLLSLGPLFAFATLRGVDRATVAARPLAACVVLAALSGVMEAEVERIWQFMIPAAAIASAPLLRSRRVLALVLMVGVAQAIGLELLFDTTW